MNIKFIKNMKTHLTELKAKRPLLTDPYERNLIDAQIEKLQSRIRKFTDARLHIGGATAVGAGLYGNKKIQDKKNQYQFANQEGVNKMDKKKPLQELNMSAAIRKVVPQSLKNLKQRIEILNGNIAAKKRFIGITKNESLLKDAKEELSKLIKERRMLVSKLGGGAVAGVAAIGGAGYAGKKYADKPAPAKTEMTEAANFSGAILQECEEILLASKSEINQLVQETKEVIEEKAKRKRAASAIGAGLATASLYHAAKKGFTKGAAGAVGKLAKAGAGAKGALKNVVRGRMATSLFAAYGIVKGLKAAFSQCQRRCGILRVNTLTRQACVAKCKASLLQNKLTVINGLVSKDPTNHKIKSIQANLTSKLQNAKADYAEAVRAGANESGAKPADIAKI